jgi:hypothetical protein
MAYTSAVGGSDDDNNTITRFAQPSVELYTNRGELSPATAFT